MKEVVQKAVVGDDYIRTLSLKDSAGTPIDITDYTVYFTVKKNSDLTGTDDDALIAFTSAIHSDPTNGKTVIRVGNAVTKTIIPGNYKYDIQIKTDEDIILTVTYGTITFIPQVTVRG